VSQPDDPLLLNAGVSARQLSQVLALVANSDIAELEVTIGHTRLSVRRPAVWSVTSAAPPTAPLLDDTPDQGALVITSPLVGIFHPAVGPGAAVQTGQAIGRIEALGLPTSVDAPRDGTVDELLVQDGFAVEYGQPLLTLRRAAHAS
jgi:acetyl-CoA carboxylase biotin carboxyl carrier protein